MFRIEKLEARQLLSASLDASGLLTVDGTNRNDKMTISVDPTASDTLDANVNGKIDKFKIADVKDIRMFGLAGNDVMKIDQKNGKIKIPVTMNGGKGNDKLIAGDGNAVLHGGEGNDTLVGGAGNDNLDGGAGNDSITGGGGSNIFHKEHDTRKEIKDFHGKHDRFE